MNSFLVKAIKPDALGIKSGRVFWGVGEVLLYQQEASRVRIVREVWNLDEWISLTEEEMCGFETLNGGSL